VRAAVILAAGRGTRMRTPGAKVLHRVGGLPLVEWVRRAVAPLVERTVVVVGHERAAVEAALEGTGVLFAVQDAQLGTGHALRCAASRLDGVKTVLVLAGDAPLLRTESLAALLEEHEDRRAAASVLTFRAADPTGYGRILRDAGGSLTGIAEEAEASDAERRVREVNSGSLALEAAEVLPLLASLPPRGAGGDRHVTDVIGLLREAGRVIAAVQVSEQEALGVNTPAQLAAAESACSARRAEDLTAAGVTLVDPAEIRIEADVEVGAGTRIHPFVSLEGATRVGERCEIGSHVRLRDVRVGAGSILHGPLALDGGEVPEGSVLSPAP